MGGDEFVVVLNLRINVIAPAAKCRDFLHGHPLGLADVDTDLLKAASG